MKLVQRLLYQLNPLFSRPTFSTLLLLKLSVKLFYSNYYGKLASLSD